VTQLVDLTNIGLGESIWVFILFHELIAPFGLLNMKPELERAKGSIVNSHGFQTRAHQDHHDLFNLLMLIELHFFEEATTKYGKLYYLR
jgi:hypothetical protein